MSRDEWGLTEEEMRLQRRLLQSIEAQRRRQHEHADSDLSYEEQLSIALSLSQSDPHLQQSATNDEDADLLMALEISKEDERQARLSSEEHDAELELAKKYSEEAFKVEQRVRQAQDEFDKNKTYTTYDQPYLATYGGVTLWLCNHHLLNPELEPDEHKKDPNSDGKVTLDNYMTNSQL